MVQSDIVGYIVCFTKQEQLYVRCVLMASIGLGSDLLQRKFCKKNYDSWAVFSSDFASGVSEELKLIFLNENKMYMLLNWNPWF